MTLEKFPIKIPEKERTTLVNWLLNLVAKQQQIIEKQQQTIAKLSEKVNSLDEELKGVKKLKGKPKISPSTLNSQNKNSKLFAHFSSTKSKSREKCLRILRVTAQNFVLKAYQEQPTSQERERLFNRFDEIFGQRYPHHYGLNLAMEQLCAHKSELLRVLDLPQLPLHTNAAETDLREYVTRQKISGGTRHDNGRRARDTFTGLKKTCRKLGLSFWRYLLSRFTLNLTVPYLPDVIRARASVPAPT